MRTTSTLALLLFVCPSIAIAQPAPTSQEAVIEIRSYNLEPGTRDQFHALFVNEALPLLKRWKVDVVAYGPSLHDRDSYYLMRAFPGVAERQKSEDAFYGSDEWRSGPRERVLAAIDTFTTVVITVDAVTLKGLRGMMQTPTSADLDVLLQLNNDYIESVRTSDVKRFSEILADDFLCTLADGTLVDRAQFLERTAQPATVGHLEAHDVKVRLLGDVAIVHARTTFTQADGKPGSGRYTDIWARRNGKWLAVAAHVTRRYKVLKALCFEV